MKILRKIGMVKSGKGGEDSMEIDRKRSFGSVTSETVTFANGTESGGQSNDFYLKRMDSLKKIQNFARQKRAVKLARAEQHWKIFSDLDTIEEAEMLHLATFLQILLDRVPTANKPESAINMDEEDEEEEEEDGAVSLKHIEVEGLGSAVMSRLTADGTFDIPKTAAIDGNFVRELIEIFRQNGKLSTNVVMKILRKTYAHLKTLGNTTRTAVPKGGKMTVVGDIHGQLCDLLHILDESGMPSETNLFVFNGDFVDRGKYGVEVVCILFSMLVAFPEYVILNRGNHEDGPISRVYGFQDECINKYDELTFGMFVEVFRFLPLFTIVNDAIFILHGGLFNNRAVRLEDLENIERTDYTAQPPAPYPACLEGMEPEAQWAEYYRQLQRDAMWSDPRLEPGLVESPRGSGVIFGPDVAQEFMDNNNLSMIIRSHECVRRGFFLPYGPTANPTMCRPDVPLLCTVFSASNYGNGDNEGAYMILMDHQHTHCHPIRSTGLFYSVHHYKTSHSNMGIESSNRSSLADLILKKKPALLTAFEAIDTSSSGIVSRAEWAQVMHNVTTVKIRWLGLLAAVAPHDSLTPTTVNYRMFLANYSVKPHEADKPIDNLDLLYGQRKKLEAIFNFFDTNGDGVISREEFQIGCATLNEHLPEGHKLTDIDHSLDLMDFDGNGMIDINEFFETFRILESKLMQSN